MKAYFILDNKDMLEVGDEFMSTLDHYWYPVAHIFTTQGERACAAERYTYVRRAIDESTLFIGQPSEETKPYSRKITVQ